MAYLILYNGAQTLSLVSVWIHLFISKLLTFSSPVLSCLHLCILICGRLVFYSYLFLHLVKNFKRIRINSAVRFIQTVSWIQKCGISWKVMNLISFKTQILYILKIKHITYSLNLQNVLIFKIMLHNIEWKVETRTCSQVLKLKVIQTN